MWGPIQQPYIRHSKPCFWIRFFIQKLSQLLGDDKNLQDEVFPNNWFSTHSDGRVVLYPMKVPSRAAEIRFDIVETVRRCIVRVGLGGKDNTDPTQLASDIYIFTVYYIMIM